MKITDITVRKIDLGPRRQPIRNAILTYTRHTLHLLEVHTDEGVVGRSLMGGRAGAQTIVEGRLRNLLLGQDPRDIERLWEWMYRGWRKPLAKGEAIVALSGVDIALWDLMGKALGQPVCRLLGAYTDRVRAYAAGGYYAEGKTVDDLVAEMVGYVEEGFTAVKMKVGGAPLREDMERVRAVREAVGPDVDLMMDANNRFTAADAIRLGRAVERYHPFWFEEPVAPDDIKGALEVKAALGIPIASGENEYTRYGCRDWIEARAVDVLQADPLLCGGISEWRKIAAMASAYHIPMAPHGSPHMSIHLMAACSNGLIMETYPQVNRSINEVLPPLPVDAEGYVRVPTAPGLGLEVAEEALTDRLADG